MKSPKMSWSQHLNSVISPSNLLIDLQLQMRQEIGKPKREIAVILPDQKFQENSFRSSQRDR